jgi:hypothetical protein
MYFWLYYIRTFTYIHTYYVLLNTIQVYFKDYRESMLINWFLCNSFIYYTSSDGCNQHIFICKTGVFFHSFFQFIIIIYPFYNYNNVSSAWPSPSLWIDRPETRLPWGFVAFMAFNKSHSTRTNCQVPMYGGVQSYSMITRKSPLRILLNLHNRIPNTLNTVLSS